MKQIHYFSALLLLYVSYSCTYDGDVFNHTTSNRVVENHFAMVEQEILEEFDIFLEQLSSNSELRSSKRERVSYEISVTEYPVETNELDRHSNKVVQKVPVFTVNYKDAEGNPSGFVVSVGDKRIKSPILVFNNKESNFNFYSEENKNFFEDLWAGYIHYCINNIVEIAPKEEQGYSVDLRNDPNCIHYIVNMDGDWNQIGDPYSRYTPYRDGSRTLAGCTAVAMGRIMAFHGWPRVGAFMRYPNANSQAEAVYVSYPSNDWQNLNYVNIPYFQVYQPQSLELIGNLLTEIGYKLNTDYRTIAQNGFRASYAFPTDVPTEYTAMGYLTNGHSAYNFSKIEGDIVTNQRPTFMAGYKLNGGGHAYIVFGLLYHKITTDKWLGIYSGNGGDISGQFHDTWWYNV